MIDSLVLGAARWGSRIDKKTVFNLLDKFVESGGRYVDSSKNYPINGVTEDFGLANRFLSEWISHNPNAHLDIFLKLGSVDNSGGPQSDLSSKSIQRDFHIHQQLFGESFRGVGVHWDDRNGKDLVQISETIQQFEHFHGLGFRVGLSGVKERERYSQLSPNLRDVWEIQVKETVDDHKARDGYLDYFPNATFLAYGISRVEPLANRLSQDHPENENLQCGPKSNEDLYYWWIQKLLGSRGVNKIIIGPRTLHQLEGILLRMPR
jgi:hypothetical protein